MAKAVFVDALIFTMTLRLAAPAGVGFVVPFLLGHG
jgi:hypothetical protein